jgi:hypothetical protein
VEEYCSNRETTGFLHGWWFYLAINLAAIAYAYFDPTYTSILAERERFCSFTRIAVYRTSINHRFSVFLKLEYLQIYGCSLFCFITQGMP